MLDYKVLEQLNIEALYSNHIIFRIQIFSDKLLKLSHPDNYIILNYHNFLPLCYYFS